MSKEDAMGIFTNEEQKVLQLVAQGNMVEEIAKKLGVEQQIIDAYRSSMIEKIKNKNKTEKKAFSFFAGI